ncbi:hypothetical protein BST61_g702 [Cercospora zeina]
MPSAAVLTIKLLDLTYINAGDADRNEVSSLQTPAKCATSMLRYFLLKMYKSRRTELSSGTGSIRVLPMVALHRPYISLNVRPIFCCVTRMISALQSNCSKAYLFLKQ